MPIDRGLRDRPVRSFLLRAAILGVLFGLVGCIRQAAPTGPFPAFSEFEDQEISRVTFDGNLQLSPDSLRALIRTRASRCRLFFIPFCVPGTSVGKEEYRLDLPTLADDLTRMHYYYRDHGYYSAQIVPGVESLGDDKVAVNFLIDARRQVILRDLTVQGVDTIFPPEQLRSALELQPGQPFGRSQFLASADTIRSRLLERGYAYADILRNFDVDTIRGIADAGFVAIPGPIVYVDTIIFDGNERLSERALRRQITTREGNVLRAADLNQSQLNLYTLEMVNYAAVRIAPDTLQVDPNQQFATVLVQLVEAAQYAVEASAGFGTVDCFRTSGRWINRNFIGGGRRLEVNGSLARIGVGAPVDLGLDRRGCTGLDEEGFLGLPGITVDDRMDYSLTGTLQQPRIFRTQNQLAISAHTERVSESGAFIRESTGGRIAAVRQIDRAPTLLTTTLEAQRSRTIANPAFLCVGFDTCTPEDLDVLSRYRWSNSVSLAAGRDAQRTEGVINRGYVLRGEVNWASPLFMSDDGYLRFFTEGSYFRPVKPGWVLATNLRFGRFLYGLLGEESGYIPPERRFYAGGPASVRGFTRNALGPTSYIETRTDERTDTIGSATGGTQMITSSVELRMPSPFMADVMRTAIFLDAGHVSAPGVELFSTTGVRFTPGVGIRFLTPVGPFRMDLAYNPYLRDPGPLYTVNPRIGLILIENSYQPDPPGFFGRFRIQFALGQAF